MLVRVRVVCIIACTCTCVRVCVNMRAREWKLASVFARARICLLVHTLVCMLIALRVSSFCIIQ